MIGRNETIESIAVVAGPQLRDRQCLERDPAARALLAGLDHGAEGGCVSVQPHPYFVDDASYRAALVEAGAKALRAAGRTPAEIGTLVGCALGARVPSPDPIYATHSALGLDERAAVMVTRGELTNLLDALAIATSHGPAFDPRPRLVVVGCRMSQWSLRFQHPLSLLVGDAVTAMVIGPGPGLRLLGMETRVLGAQGGALHLGHHVRADDGGIAEEVVLDAAAGRLVAEMGPAAPVQIVRRLLARFGVAPQDVALAPTQSIVGLAERWREALGIPEMFESMSTLGNAGPVSVGANLREAWRRGQRDRIVAVQLGWGLHFTAALFDRSA